jgi:uncharacterized membrane protein
MASVIQTIDVRVPVRTAYDQWTQFESFPQFMEGVKEVRQTDATHLHWTATINGNSEHWEGEITQQIPDERVAWKSTTGAPNAGVVTFHRLGPAQTRVTVQMEWQPQGAAEGVGSALGFDDRQIKGDLERFKTFIEERGSATGAWRGTVDQSATS